MKEITAREYITKFKEMNEQGTLLQGGDGDTITYSQNGQVVLKVTKATHKYPLYWVAE